jgi:SAM-dependent methyltransferase
MNPLLRYIGKLGLKTPGRYYVNKSYARWNHNVKGKILEIGGGRAEKYNKNSIILDIDPNLNPDIVASGYNLPFKDDAFDTIVSAEVLEHLEKPQIFVNGIYRVLKRDGAFFLTTRFIYEIHGEIDYFRYTRLSLRTLFDRFKIVNVKEQGSVLSVLCYFIVSIFPSPLQIIFYNMLSPFYPLIEKIDQHGRKRITLGYSIYGRK